MKEITRVEYQHRCLRCEREFISRSVAPVRCSKCDSPYWDKPRVASGARTPRKGG